MSLNLASVQVTDTPVALSRQCQASSTPGIRETIYLSFVIVHHFNIIT
nr:MAG TPA: hypothetical protein [Bacteriophage sp.]